MKCLVTGGRRFAERYELYLESGGKPDTPEAERLQAMDALDKQALIAALEGFVAWAKQKKASTITFIHGACPRGADSIVANWIAYMNTAYFAGTNFQNKFGYPNVIEDAHPADWVTHGPKAGPMRNTDMVECNPNYCIAAWDGSTSGSGTFD
jgi:hypothetical protein